MDIRYLENWKFSLDAHTDPWAPDFDDASWEEVIVPHDWAVSFPFSREHSSGTGYLPGGTGWYRTVFSVVPGENRQVFVNFDGVYKNSRVWCNGYYLGCRPSGYTGFRYDISHCVRPGDANVIAVKVAHEDIADSRWYTGSGIYGRVSVQSHGPLYIEPESLVVESEVRENGAAVARIRGNVVNRGPAAAAVLSRAVLSRVGLSRSGLTGGGGERFDAETTLPHVEGNAPFCLEIPLAGPRLWSAENPNLYRLNLELYVDGSRVYAAAPLAVGIRSFYFDPDRGFFINGNNEKIKGVCVHHDSGCLGAAVWPDVWRRRLGKLKDMGCNAMRMSHNPHVPELYDLCDELGFYVMEEAFDEWEGCKNKWVRGHNVYPPAHQGYYEDFPQWHERDLADMVIRGRNHPSIIIWSIGNEIDYPNDPYVHPLFTEMTGNNDANKPRAEREYNPRKPNMERLAVIATELTGIVKKYDRSRPVLAASAFPELSSRIGFFDSLDMVGYNYKEQLYQADHKRFPHLPIIGSENGHHAAAWQAVTDNDYISGQFLWTGIDFLGEAWGWPVRGSMAGLLDTAGFEKPAYFRRRALWDAKPVLYLVTALRTETENGRFDFSRSWNYRPGDSITVRCYGNRGPVELFLNGKSLGCPGGTEEFPTWIVPFERGKLEARVPGAEVDDTLESTLPAVQFRLIRRRFRDDTGNAAALSAYTLSQVELELLDEGGRLCVTENPTVHISLSGTGTILGIENGDLSDLTEFRAPWRRVYRGRLIVYVLTGRDAGETVTLTASAAGFAPAAIDLCGRD